MTLIPSRFQCSCSAAKTRAIKRVAPIVFWVASLVVASSLVAAHPVALQGNGHSVLEVTPDKKIAWQLTQRELPGIVLAWVTTLDVLPNGNYVIGNCHAGPGQPLIIEVEPKSKRVVWRLDQFERWGNSVSNSLVLSK